MAIIHAVLFDHDGLLVDSEPWQMSAWKSVLENLGWEITEEQMRSYVGKSLEVIASDAQKKIKKPVSAVDLVDRKTKAYLSLLPHVKLMSGVTELITALKKNHLRLAVVSSSPRQEVIGALQMRSIFSKFDVIVAAEDVTHHKPAPNSYLLAAKRLNLQPNECVVFEDSPSGVAAAKAAGMFCIAVPSAFTKSHSFKQADIVIDSVYDLLGNNSSMSKTRNPMLGKLLG